MYIIDKAGELVLAQCEKYSKDLAELTGMCKLLLFMFAVCLAIEI